MSSAHGDYERRYSRVQLPIAAQVTCAAMERYEEPAHLRDVSAGGAFFYADLNLEPGAIVRVDFMVPVVGSEVQITCEGSVVRVERHALGDRSGIAIQFASLHLS
jgi:c-di-GMP-binding flagellar brake protein YcgR